MALHGTAWMAGLGPAMAEPFVIDRLGQRLRGQAQGWQAPERMAG